MGVLEEAGQGNGLSSERQAVANSEDKATPGHLTVNLNKQTYSYRSQTLHEQDYGSTTSLSKSMCPPLGVDYGMDVK